MTTLDLDSVPTANLLREVAKRVPKPKLGPPSFCPTPAEAAARADLLVQIYMLFGGDEIENACSDLITDLLHWRDSRPEKEQPDQETVLYRAVSNHDAEVAEHEDGNDDD